MAHASKITPGSELLRSHVLVREWDMEGFRRRLSALNRKGERFGVPEITVLAETVRPFKAVTQSNEHGTLHTLEPFWGDPSYGDRVVLLHEVELQYPIIKMGHWDVLAQLEDTAAGALAFTTSRDPQDMAKVMSLAGQQICCEHCNVQRKRNLGFLLKDSRTGQYKQVGSTCLEDFTGIDPAKALFMAKMSTFVAEESDPFAGIPRGAERTLVRDYLIHALFAIEKYGFMSAARAGELGDLPTYKVAENMPTLFQRNRALHTVFEQSSDRLGEMTDAMIQWYADLEPADPYAMTVKTLLSGLTLKSEPRQLAYVAGAVPGFLRMLNQQRNGAAADAISVHQGKVGEKMERALAVQRIVSTPTQFGLQFRVVMRDGQGNEFCWKTGNPPSELQRVECGGRPFLAKFKVKEHRAFDGKPVTDVSHLKFGGWCEALTSEAIAEEKAAEADSQMRP